MAQDPEQTKSIEQLKQEIAHSRDRLANDLSGLKYELDFPLKFRKSFQRKTSLWIAAAAVLGVASTVIPRRTKKIYVEKKEKDGGNKKLLETGFALGAMKIAMNVLRPVLIRFVTNKLAGTGGRPRSSPKW